MFFIFSTKHLKHVCESSGSSEIVKQKTFWNKINVN